MFVAVQILSIILCQFVSVDSFSVVSFVPPHNLQECCCHWSVRWCVNKDIGNEKKLCGSEVRNSLDIKGNCALYWHSSLQHFILPWICSYYTFSSIVRFLVYWCQYQKTFCLLHVYSVAFRVYMAFRMLILVVPISENETVEQNCLCLHFSKQSHKQKHQQRKEPRQWMWLQ